MWIRIVDVNDSWRKGNRLYIKLRTPERFIIKIVLESKSVSFLFCSNLKMFTKTQRAFTYYFIDIFTPEIIVSQWTVSHRGVSREGRRLLSNIAVS